MRKKSERDLIISFELLDIIDNVDKEHFKIPKKKQLEN